MYNIDPYLLSSSLPLNPNRYTLEIVKDRKKDFDNVRRSGLALFDSEGAETRHIKNLDKYVNQFEPIIEQQEKKEEYDKTVLGKIENALKSTDDTVNDFISKILGNIDYKVYLFFIFLVIVFIKI